MFSSLLPSPWDKYEHAKQMRQQLFVIDWVFVFCFVFPNIFFDANVFRCECLFPFCFRALQ